MDKKFNNLKDATGPIPYGLRNDYMFRAVFQESKEALKGLLCSILHFNEDDIKSIVVCNPIELGKNINGKDYVLDLKIMFNDNTIVNIEMQVINKGNWPERSLSYLCRNFDNLNKGTDYMDVKTAIHIGFINFTLFENCPEFCATYLMKNAKNDNVYSSKFILKVVELNNTKLATEEDKYYGIDRWAQLFKAATWEEIKMYAANNKAMENVVNKVFEYNSEETMRDICRAREESIAYQMFMDNRAKEMEQNLIKMEDELEEKKKQLVRQNEQIAEQNEQIINKDEQLIRQKQKLEEKEQELLLAKKLIEELQAKVQE